MEFKISDLRWDEFIWPRCIKNPRQSTIDAYEQALAAGAEFPDIIVQRVKNYPLNKDVGEATLIIDGVHRWSAYKKQERDVIEGNYWKDEILDYEVCKKDLLAAGALYNKEHGDRTSEQDKKETAQKLVRNDPEIEWTEQRISETIGAPRTTVSGWVSHIRARQRASRDAKIIRLAQLGWRQREIASLTGLSHNRISQIVSSDDFVKIDNLRDEQGHEMSWIAEHLGIDLTLAWSLYLEGKSDDERMEELGITVKKYTVWNYTDAHDLMGRSDFSGRIPGQIVANTLYWFTKPGDLVIDPMAGSGTTIDACLLLGRRCYAYDINVTREDILQNDIREGFPEGTRTPDFIFVDPPYWNLKQYSDSLSLEGFYDLLCLLAQSCYNLLKPGNEMAVLMGNQSAQKWLPKRTHRLDHVQKEYEIFVAQGFEKRWGIDCPMPTQNAQRWAEAEWDSGRLGEITRELTIWRRL